MGVRVTPNSGDLLGRESLVEFGLDVPTSCEATAGGGGAGGGGAGGESPGGGAWLLATCMGALVGAVGVTEDVRSLIVLVLEPRNASSTPDTTIAAMAAHAATIAVVAALVRYHGVGGGVKLQLSVSNASKWPVSCGSGWLSQKLSSGSSHMSSSGPACR